MQNTGLAILANEANAARLTMAMQALAAEVIPIAEPSPAHAEPIHARISHARIWTA